VATLLNFHLGWPLNNSDWPEFDEPDFIELDLGGTIAAWFHLWQATAGNDQIGLKTGTSTADFHVVRHERIPPRPACRSRGGTSGRGRRSAPE